MPIRTDEWFDEHTCSVQEDGCVVNWGRRNLLCPHLRGVWLKGRFFSIDHLEFKDAFRGRVDTFELKWHCSYEDQNQRYEYKLTRLKALVPTNEPPLKEVKMHGNMSDIIYGLRNLTVMDDEQTRIDDDYVIDFVPQDVRPFVVELVKAGEYGRAYRVAIIAWARGVSVAEIEAAIPAWRKDFGSDCVTAKDIAETLYELLY